MYKYSLIINSMHTHSQFLSLTWVIFSCTICLFLGSLCLFSSDLIDAFIQPVSIELLNRRIWRIVSTQLLKKLDNVCKQLYILKMGHYRPLFLYFRLLNTVDRKQMFNIKFCLWLDLNRGPLCRKRPLFQLSHNHYTELSKSVEISKTQQLTTWANTSLHLLPLKSFSQYLSHLLRLSHSIRRSLSL